MIMSVRVAPPNSLVGIADSRTKNIPRSLARGSGIAWTRACIIVTCLAFVDGDTRFTLTQAPSVGTDHNLVFDGLLDTPNHRVAVWTVEWEKLLEAEVPSMQTRVRVWTNHPTDPDDVIIGLG